MNPFVLETKIPFWRTVGITPTSAPTWVRTHDHTGNSSPEASVVDPNTLNLYPDPGFWPNLNPDPGSSWIRIQYGSGFGSTTMLNTFFVSLIVNLYLKSYLFCLHFNLYLHVWIRIRIKNTDPGSSWIRIHKTARSKGLDHYAVVVPCASRVRGEGGQGPGIV